jgi:hypothetical protein
VDIYALVLGGLHGYGWSTIEDVVRRSGLPWAAVQNTLTELVGEDRVLVKIDREGEGEGRSPLVYAVAPS